MLTSLILLGCVTAGTFCMLRRLRHCGRRDWTTQRTCMRLVWRECEEVWVLLEDTPFGAKYGVMRDEHVWTTDEVWDRIGLNDAGR
jgi:hypothetical protein